MTDTPPNPAPSREQVLVSGLAGFPDELARLVAGRSVDDLKRPTSDGGWGVIEVLGHLADWEEIFVGRAQVMLSQENPQLPVFDDQLWEVEHEYRSQNPFHVLDRLRQHRLSLVQLVTDLNVDDWQRTATIGTEHGVTLENMLQQIREHDQKHLRAISDALG